MSFSIISSLKNPICIGPSGYFGQNDISNVGAIFTKSITYNSKEGSSGLSLVDVGSERGSIHENSLINNVVLKNNGLDYFIRHELNYLYSTGIPIIVSIAGKLSEIRDLVGTLAFLAKDKIVGIEINLFCPNLGDQAEIPTCDIRSCVENAIEVADGIPIILKLPPRTESVVGLAIAAKYGGAAAITISNTIPALTFIDNNPFVGGLSGEYLRPISQRCVHEVRKSVDIDIIGCGGISSIDHVKEYLSLGCVAVQVISAEIKRAGLTSSLASKYNYNR